MKPHSLIDPFGRQITYLRLSVTDKCNMRCQYCMSEDMQFLPKSKVMSIEEIQEISEAFVELGIQKIRLTGGEPLVRKGVDQLIKSIGELPLNTFTLTTNGILLEKYLDTLIQAKVKRINVSLDAVDAQIFKQLGRADELHQVLSGLATAKQHGIKVRLNSVIIEGINDNQILPLTRFAIENDFDIVFIEEMPLGETISYKQGGERSSQYFSDDVLNLLADEYTLEPVANDQTLSGPARYQQVVGTDTQVGFISPHSQNFCKQCNRLRVTVQGKLLLCLGHEKGLEMLPILRAENYQRDDLKQAIVEAIKHKPEKHEFKPQEIEIKRFMSATGG